MSQKKDFGESVGLALYHSLKGPGLNRNCIQLILQVVVLNIHRVYKTTQGLFNKSSQDDKFDDRRSHSLLVKRCPSLPILQLFFKGGGGAGGPNPYSK